MPIQDPNKSAQLIPNHIEPLAVTTCCRKEIDQSMSVLLFHYEFLERIPSQKLNAIIIGSIGRCWLRLDRRLESTGKKVGNESTHDIFVTIQNIIGGKIISFRDHSFASIRRAGSGC